MDDKKIEQLLNRAWNVQPPDGMRERVLRRSRQELPKQEKRRWKPTWRFVLAGLALLVIFASYPADSARQSRLTAMLEISDPAAARMVVAGMTKERWGLKRLFAGDYTRHEVERIEQGDDAL